MGAIVGLLAVGALIGPLIAAMSKGAVAESDDSARWRQAYGLLQAYDEFNPNLGLHDGDWEMDIQECGYRRDEVYDPNDNVSTLERPLDGPVPYRDVRWTPYSGHFALHGWRSRQFRSRVETLRSDRLKHRFGPFWTVFLEQCIQHSVAAPLCARKVAHALDEGHMHSPHSGPPDQAAFLDGDRETQVICTYLDGLAARRGHRLAERPNRR